ncbi:MAG: cytochrome c [Planctomycetes bacterium]|nr:cytochrome c [Planctomycetota bacterium]
MSEGRRTALAWGIVLVALFTARSALSIDPEQRGREFLPDMVESLAAESFAASAVLPGGHVQQPLADGVVLLGARPFPYASDVAGAEAAGRELANPWRADDAVARARGAERYAIACAPCHGGDGGGRGPVVERGMVPPPSLLAARARALPDGHLFHVITRGQGNMAPHAALVAPDDRWKVILHVRALQEANR